jgi:hypothetical protein
LILHLVCQWSQSDFGRQLYQVEDSTIHGAEDFITELIVTKILTSKIIFVSASHNHAGEIKTYIILLFLGLQMQETLQVRV